MYVQITVVSRTEIETVFLNNILKPLCNNIK